jgi:hypothetical protein
MTLPNCRLRLVHDRVQVENCTLALRRFLGIQDREPTELTFFIRGRIHLAHAATVNDHLRLLREAERLPGFNGAYQLVNGPINPAIFARYQLNRIHPAWNGRVGDSDVELRRAIYIDVDPIRPKGISATNDEKRAARDVCSRVEDLLLSVLQDECVLGRGDSGNGYFILIAIEPAPISTESTARIRELLKRLASAYDTDRVKIDTSVGNAARLMPAAGTWKRKGENTPERPHRQSSFSCCGSVRRVALENVVGNSH